MLGIDPLMFVPTGGDNTFLFDLYARYRRDRYSVSADWIVYFDQIEAGGQIPEAHSPTGTFTAGIAARLQDGYRRAGHIEAQLDPLTPNKFSHASLDELRSHAAAQSSDSVLLRIAGSQRSASLGEIELLLRQIYAGHAAIEAEHIPQDDERAWLYDAFEETMSSPAEPALVAQALDAILQTDTFETFMRVKFPTKKRFGSEGAESSIAFLLETLRSAAGTGITHVIAGGMHRGRLATLAVALKKGPSILARELQGRDASDDPARAGDVPYHLGYANELTFSGTPIQVKLLPHPSHLMVVAPVALGYARATAKAAGVSTLSLLLHTDAAFSGQGLTSELLQIGGLGGYGAGGSIHLVVNNQIGFTTLPSEGRSSRYCTDAAKAVSVPVFHVNADDPIAVAKIANLAVAWRNTFHKDVVVDLVCYRRFGHNELDEPRFTQPMTWKAVDHHPSVRRIFTERAKIEFPLEVASAEKCAEAYLASLREGFEASDGALSNDTSIQDAAWRTFSARGEDHLQDAVETGVDIARLRDIGIAISTLPDGMKANPKVSRFYKERLEALRSGTGLNFATAEVLAFASLLTEGIKVRLSGQDAVRGTFTQRHLAVHDMETGESCLPLARVAPQPGLLEMVNSPLSEYGVLGFEYGHSLVDPQGLTMWEAQFGDFLNGAQIVVDQYIVSAEAKWQVKSGLVVMLPHGLEGQGPDHSSARIERIAQLYCHGNILIAQPTTPANLFHLLRRQIKAPWRKPLFLIAPKALLRAKAAISSLEDMGNHETFRPVIIDHSGRPEQVRRVILCSGKIYYALHNAREQAGLAADITLVRVEQIAPFPLAEIKRALAPFSKASCAWCQEEAENQGPWPFASQFLPGIAPTEVIARPAASVSAGGSIERHEHEQRTLLTRAMRM